VGGRFRQVGIGVGRILHCAIIGSLIFSEMSSSFVLNVDLHCHSTASDGLLPAAEVARRAAANGTDMLALTDHDNLGGLAAARAVANETGMRFINGVEISIEWKSLQIHIVGLNFDADDPALNAGLASIRSGRVNRAQRMSDELEKVGITGCFDGAMRHAEDPSLISRAHFARYLAEIGVCKDVRSVFESYIVPGKPGYVDHQWPSLADSVGWILGAGGLAVVAHPGRYKLSRPELRRFLDEFKAVGGQAVEVVSGSHSTENVNTFTRLAKEYGFMASCGSDFHGPAESYVDLGKLAPLPAGLTPVWESF
jgi:predicted metal-dependent phosphoesterase TrpH